MVLSDFPFALNSTKNLVFVRTGDDTKDELLNESALKKQSDLTTNKNVVLKKRKRLKVQTLSDSEDFMQESKMSTVPPTRRLKLKLHPKAIQVVEPIVLVPPVPTSIFGKLHEHSISSIASMTAKDNSDDAIGIVQNYCVDSKSWEPKFLFREELV